MFTNHNIYYKIKKYAIRITFLNFFHFTAILLRGVSVRTNSLNFKYLGNVRKDIRELLVNRGVDILHSALNVKINVTATENIVIIKLGVYRVIPL